MVTTELIEKKENSVELATAPRKSIHDRGIISSDLQTLIDSHESNKPSKPMRTPNFLHYYICAFGGSIGGYHLSENQPTLMTLGGLLLGSLAYIEIVDAVAKYKARSRNYGPLDL